MKKLKMVIFDLDGVILDSEPLHVASIIQVLADRGASGYDPMTNVGMSSEKMFASLIERYHLDAEPEQLVGEMTDYDEEEMIRRNMPPSDGLIPLLDALSAEKILLGIASSSERRFVQSVLKHLHLEERFSWTAAGTEAPRKKPYPDLYERVLTLSGVQASEAAAVEDSATGIRAAKAAGLFTVGYRNPTSGNQDLSAADAVVENLADAVPILLSR